MAGDILSWDIGQSRRPYRKESGEYEPCSLLSSLLPERPHRYIQLEAKDKKAVVVALSSQPPMAYDRVQKQGRGPGVEQRARGRHDSL